MQNHFALSHFKSNNSCEWLFTFYINQLSYCLLSLSKLNLLIKGASLYSLKIEIGANFYWLQYILQTQTPFLVQIQGQKSLNNSSDKVFILQPELFPILIIIANYFQCTQKQKLSNIMRTAQQVNQSFRKQIRNRQKQQYFKNIRNRFQQLENEARIQQSQAEMQVQMSMQSIRITSNHPDSEMYLKALAEQIKKSNTANVCNKVLDQGLHHQLINNLKKNNNVEATLTVISAITGKQNLRVSHKFIRIGLIDQLIGQSDYLKEDTTIGLCMNILANIVFQNNQYGEMMLQNKIHKHLFSLGQKIILENPKYDVNHQSAGFYIMWALAALLQVENTAPYKEQFLEILQFSLEVAKRQYYPKLMIDIIFLVGYSFREQVQATAATVLNSFLDQIESNCSHLQSLLITIKLLSPLKVNYQKISTLILTCENKLISYSLRILQKIALTNPEAIPRNIQWWERLYLKIVKQDDIQYYVNLLNKCRIKSDWIYGILNEILQKYPLCITLINQTLLFINSLIEKSQPQERKKVKFYLKSSNICQRLTKLYESKNTEISRKCEYLLSVINLDLQV